VKRLLQNRENRSDRLYKDLNRRLNRYLAATGLANDVVTVEKAAIERYLAQYTGRNQLNHLRALSNFFRFTLGSAPSEQFQRAASTSPSGDRGLPI